MSMEAIQAVFESDLSDAAWQVAIAIADRINGSGEAWPSVADIARRTRLSRATILRAIPKVERSGIFGVSRNTGRVNTYCFPPSQNDTGIKTPPVSKCDPARLIMRPHPSHSVTNPSQNETQTHITQKESNTNPIAREAEGPKAAKSDSGNPAEFPHTPDSGNPLAPGRTTAPESATATVPQPAQELPSEPAGDVSGDNTTNLPAKGGKPRKTANPAVSGDALHCAKAFAVLRRIKAGSERSASASTVDKFAAAVFEPLLADYSRDEVLLVLDWLHEDPQDKWRFGCANLPAGYKHALVRMFAGFLESAKRWEAAR